MNILVTGGKSGFLARNLKESLTNEEKKIYSFVSRQEYNLTNVYEVEQLFVRYKPTHIVHLAGMASARNNDNSWIDDNIKATYNLLNFCPDKTDFIFASTMLVYGSGTRCAFENDTCKPNTPYAISKLCCENMIKMFEQRGKVRGRILRLCGIVGPYLKHGRVYEVINGQRSFNLMGKAPGNFVPYITTEDVVQVIKNAVKYNKPSLLTNIVPPEDSISIERTLQVLSEELGEKIEVKWQPNNAFPNEELYGYDTKCYYELNYRIQKTSEEALRWGVQQNIKGKNASQHKSPNLITV